ncbi:major capsid protein [Methylophaga thalassica]|uniref:major capsid protein n=1 Tax=Methylophaga thalassica TaxID=40223 RepID=UPI002E7B87B3|nr:major capsid protein [Methylophaga thalassica]WVI84158.1 major capsid protein [Methylophaga thalassica]
MKKITYLKKVASDAAKTAALLGTSVYVSVANAAVDTTAATTAITTDGGAAITEVGTALIGLAGLAVVYKWVKGSIFG